MNCHARWLIVGTFTLALGTWFLAANDSRAADKDVTDNILKIAAAIEKKDMAGAKKLSAALKDTELGEIMTLFKLRTKKGLGIGSAAEVVKPDGIEAKLMALGENPPPQKELDSSAADLANAAYIMAAIAEAARDKCPVDKKQGDMDPKKWQAWTEDMRKSSIELAEAIKAKKPKDVNKAANKVISSCNSCHTVFRD